MESSWGGIPTSRDATPQFFNMKPILGQDIVSPTRVSNPRRAKA